MTEAPLNIHDKSKLKADIKISLMIGILFSVALVVLVGLIPSILLLFGKQPSDGFLKRSLYVLGLLFIPFIAISWTNILKYIDLKKEVKLIIKTDDYAIIKQKDTAFILTGGDRKQKIKIDNDLVDYITLSQPLTIEISKLSRLLLFISHGNDNLLNKLYSEDEKSAS